jgi:hypothetical protein
MAKKKLSRDQKRKQKLQKRSHGNPAAGRQSAAEKLVRDTEHIIHETFMSFGRQMTDADALEAVNQLVVDVQQGNISKADASAETPNAKGALVWNIKQQWTEKRALEPMPRLVAAKAIQALAQRIDGIQAPGASHSYLRFLQGTQQTAVLAAPVRTTDAATESVALPAGDWSPEESQLLEAGLNWLRASNEETWKAFQSEGARLNNAGQAQAVANVSQYLYGLVRAEPVERALRTLLDEAHAKLSGEEPEEIDKIDAVEDKTTEHEVADSGPELVAEAEGDRAENA